MRQPIIESEITGDILGIEFIEPLKFLLPFGVPGSQDDELVFFKIEVSDHAVQNIKQLVRDAFDSVPAGSDTKLYFLGIRDLDSKRVLKIMIREARTSVGLDYAIRYAISSR